MDESSMSETSNIFVSQDEFDESMSVSSHSSDCYEDSASSSSYDSSDHKSVTETVVSDESDSTFRLMMLERNIWSKINTTYKKFEEFYHNMEEYYLIGTYTDVDVMCKDEYVIFKCHRLALAAASGYFYDLFREHPDQDVVLKDIDKDTFEKIILPYVYTGRTNHQDQIINGDNVYSALQASTILRMSAIEDHCVHFLTQGGVIPMDCALDLYLYASSTHKFRLLPTLGQFILKNLDQFSRDIKFLSMSREDFSALLTYFQTSFSSACQERILLNAILRWVCHSTDIREYRKLYFTELAGEVEFRFVSAAYVSEYMDRIVESGPSEVPETSNLGSYSVIDQKTTIHAYIQTTSDTTSIFSLNENFTSHGIDWHHSCTISRPAIEKMRIVESDGRLYYLKYQDERFTFGSSTAIDLCTNMQSLALPAELGSIPDKLGTPERSLCHTRLFSLCSLQKKIYMRSNLVDFFQWYNTEVDLWSAIPTTPSNCILKDIVSDGTRLYLIDLNKSYRVSLFAAYDPRVGMMEKLSTEGLGGRITDWSEPAVYHKDRIYLPEDDLLKEYKSTFKMAAYDPTAGRWDVRNVRSHFSFDTFGRQLVSFNERLWMIGWDSPGNENAELFTQIYESYAQEWDHTNYSTLNSAVLNADLCSDGLTDVIAF